MHPLYWIAYVLLLVHETCEYYTACPFLVRRTGWLMRITAMLVLILANAFMRAKFNLGRMTVSKGYRLIVSDGKPSPHFSPTVPDI